jgi:hypothetical protein
MADVIAYYAALERQQQAISTLFSGANQKQQLPPMIDSLGDLHVAGSKRAATDLQWEQLRRQQELERLSYAQNLLRRTPDANMTAASALSAGLASRIPLSGEGRGIPVPATLQQHQQQYQLQLQHQLSELASSGGLHNYSSSHLMQFGYPPPPAQLQLPQLQMNREDVMMILQGDASGARSKRMKTSSPSSSASRKIPGVDEHEPPQEPL